MNLFRLGTERVTGSFRLIQQITASNNLFSLGATTATSASTGALVRQPAPPQWLASMPTNFNVTFGVPSNIDLSVDVFDPDGNAINLAMAIASAPLPSWLTLDSPNKRLHYDGTGPPAGVVQPGLIVSATDLFLVPTNLTGAGTLSAPSIFLNGTLIASPLTTATALSVPALSTPTLIASNLLGSGSLSVPSISQSGALVAVPATSTPILSVGTLSQGITLTSSPLTTATSTSTPAIVSSQFDPPQFKVVRRSQMQGTVQVARIQ